MRERRFVAAALVVMVTIRMGMAQMALIEGVTMNQLADTRQVVVTYQISQPGITTCRFLENGVALDAPGSVRTLHGAINQYLPPNDNGGYSFVWDAGRDLPERKFSSLTAEITLWPTNNPPLYCALSLIKLKDVNDIRWYGSADEVPFGVEDERWKREWILLRKIPSTAGEFVRQGSLPAEEGRTAAREAVCRVRLTQPFYLAVYQMTQEQYYRVMGARTFTFSLSRGRETRPADNVSYNICRGSTNEMVDWPDTGSFVAEGSLLAKLRTLFLNQMEFDLPTEAQWEHACRAGTSGRFNNGFDPTLLGRYQENGGYVVVDGVLTNPAVLYGSNSETPVTHGTAPVGSYLPNAWGLYDMHGNVFEMCRDWLINSRDAQPVDDPGGPRERGENGYYRVIRGGGWYSSLGQCRSAYRYLGGPHYTSYGVRLFAPACFNPVNPSEEEVEP